MSRDLTEKQFWAALRRRYPLAQPRGFLGYVAFKFKAKDCVVCISRLNGGERRRDQLAYLLREAGKYQGEEELT